jgi:hypothetical protein
MAAGRPVPADSLDGSEPDERVARPVAGAYVNGMNDESIPALLSEPEISPDPEVLPESKTGADSTAVVPLPKEIGGAKGPEPTRYGDWEHKGRCTDF